MEEFLVNLREYVKEDIIYQKYKKDKVPYEEFNDFEKFCIDHCKDIDNLMEAYRSLKIKYSIKKRKSN